jgi:hypothetical protein
MAIECRAAPDHAAYDHRVTLQDRHRRSLYRVTYNDLLSAGLVMTI